MKSKLVIAGAVALAVFVAVALLLEHLAGGPKRSGGHSQITVAADGKVLVRPPSQPQMTVVANQSVLSNAPARGR